MIICTGKATKRIEEFQYHTKEYIATLQLGATTLSYDLEKEIDATYPTEHITREMVEEVLQQFKGTIEQIPPAFSACKVDGKRAYDLARKGDEVELKPKTLVIDEIELLECNLPEIKIRVVCSKGTYIRTLCHDIGEKLGCGAAMETLLRTKVGRFTLDDAITLAQTEEAVKNGEIESKVLGIEEILAEYPRVCCTKEGDRLLANGNPLSDNLVRPQHKEGWVRMYASDGTFTGIFQWDAGKKKYYPVKMF